MAWPSFITGLTPFESYQYHQPSIRSSRAIKIADLLSPIEHGSIHPARSSFHTYASPTTRTSLQPLTSQPTRSAYRAPSTQQWETFLQSQVHNDVSPSSSRVQYRDQVSQPRSTTADDQSSQASSEQRFEGDGSAISPILPVSSPSATTTLAWPLDYELVVRQQPKAARACGHGDRDRRVIDPPPILELRIKHKLDGSPSQDAGATFVLNCSLIDAQTGQEPVGELDARKMTSCLMGTSVMNPIDAKDEWGKAGRFFVFSDLSCRLTGSFKLRLCLLRIDVLNLRPGAKHGMVTYIDSEVFTSYTAKDFPGMQASTPLLRALRRHGLNVGLKKGSEARKLKGRARSRSTESGAYSDRMSDVHHGQYGYTDAGAVAVDKVRSHKKLRREGGN